MKYLRLFTLVILICFIPAANAAERWAYESPLEFFTLGDFDGDTRDDLIIADKNSGAFRVALQPAPQTYAWSSPANCGFSNITSVTSGRLLTSTSDALAFTTPSANRVQFMSISSATAPWLPSDRHLTDKGPVTLTSIDIGGAGNVNTIDDLYLGSIWNDSLPLAHTTLRNTTTLTLLARTFLGAPPARANAVRMQLTQPLYSAVLLRQSGFDTLLVSSNVANSLETAAMAPAQTGSDFVAAQLEISTSLARFLVWKSGSSNLTRFPVTTNTTGAFSFGASSTFALDLPIAQLFILPGAAGPRLLVIHTGNTNQSVYNYDGTTNPPVLFFRTNAPTGETFSGALALGGRDFMSFTSNDGSGRTTTMRTARNNGGGYTIGSAVTLPALNHYGGQGNVLLFRNEPFVNNNPGLVSSLNAGDWSSLPTLTGTVNATRENYASENTGLATPVAIQLGSVPSGVTSVLANQRSNNISFFSLTPPVGNIVSEVRITPDGGIFDRAISVTLGTATATDQIHYRLNGIGNWQIYSGPFTLISNATVQAFGQPAASSLRSAVRTAVFNVRTPVAQLDSDGDGVLDYVERAKGINPTSGADSDGDAWNDLEELVYGSNPNNPASRPPPNSAPVSLNAGVTIEAQPIPRDYIANAVTESEIGTIVRLHTASGEFIGEESMAAPTTLTLPDRAARFANVIADPSARLLALVTEPHFDIETTNSDTRVGRELLTVFEPPIRQAIVVSNFYSGTNDARDASNWVASVKSAISNAPLSALAVNFTRFETLSALLVERKISNILLERTNLWATNITLFAARTLDVGRTNISPDVLFSIERRVNNSLPGYRLPTMLNSISNNVATAALPGVSQLRTLVSEIYRISSLSNNASPGVYPLPVDVIRQFLADGTVQSNYAPVIAVAAGQLTQARVGVSNILAQIPPRPETNLTVTLAVSECAPALTLVKELSGVPHLLVDAAGLPFTLPQNFSLLPGSQLFLTGYTDSIADSSVAATCRTNPLEVISASLTATPIASDPDTDGNLLIDTWERAFFGNTGFHAFEDTDGDGYQDLQEMLEGSDPGDQLNVPSVAAVVLGPVKMRAAQLPNGLIRLQWSWPANYAAAVTFALRGANNLSEIFENIPSTPAIIGDEYSVFINPNTVPVVFFRLTVQLR